MELAARIDQPGSADRREVISAAASFLGRATAHPAGTAMMAERWMSS